MRQGIFRPYVKVPHIFNCYFHIRNNWEGIDSHNNWAKNRFNDF